MFNRIRVCHNADDGAGGFALLQLVSGGLLFSSLQHNQQPFVGFNELRQQQSQPCSTWDLMLQTRINLSRSAARMMMDASANPRCQNGFTPECKTTLAQAAAHYATFKNMMPLPAMAEASANVDEKISALSGRISRTYSVSDNGNMDAYFAQPTRNAKRVGRGRWANTGQLKPVPPVTIQSVMTTVLRNGNWGLRSLEAI